MQLDDYRIDDLHFSLNDDYRPDAGPDEIIQYADNYDFEKTVYKRENSDVFLVEFRIMCNEEEIDNEPKPYSFNLCIKGIFSFAEETTEEQIARMINLNSIAVLYGLARGIIAQVTAHTPMGKIILPTVNFVEYFREKEQQACAPEESAAKKKTAKKKTAKKISAKAANKKTKKTAKKKAKKKEKKTPKKKS